MQGCLQESEKQHSNDLINRHVHDDNDTRRVPHFTSFSLPILYTHLRRPSSRHNYVNRELNAGARRRSSLSIDLDYVEQYGAMYSIVTGKALR